MIDIRTLRIQVKLLKSLKLLTEKMVDIEVFSEALKNAEHMLEKYCDNSFLYEKHFLNAVVDLLDAICSEVYLHMHTFGYGDEEVTPELSSSSNAEIMKQFENDICNLEKLIIRGSEEGAPLTDEERTEWWKMQKQREREEFYKLNGYYEDEV
ncbi:MAG: hypothetical protein IJ599_00330 [Alphaproteobacteria bacterium]|nr:hypothetical protein [Alphaproteobacteria bacterium]